MPSTDTTPVRSPTIPCAQCTSRIHITPTACSCHSWTTIKQTQLQDALLLMDVAGSDSGDSTAAESPKPASRAAQQRHERNLTRAFSQLSQMCQSMDLSLTIDHTARSLYQRAEARSLHRGKSLDAVLATCIFLACRQEGVPRTFKEICALTRVPRRDIGRTFKLLKDKLGACSMSSGDLMARFCANLSLLRGAVECAVELSRRARECDTLAGKSPVSVAGACIYMASHLVGQPRDAKVISNVAGVSEVTIKNSYRLLFADRKRLLSDDLLALAQHASIDLLPLP
ncbi:transcription initiation factor IIB [Linderina pennispora]|nr:transcription initiation factor IIB [Linderina pennispora]